MTELKLPILEAVLNYEPEAKGRGLCFFMATALALDLVPDPGYPECEVVLGTLAGDASADMDSVHSPVPFIHAWVEWKTPDGHVLLAPTTMSQTGGKLVPINPTAYYAMNGVTDTKRIPRSELFSLEPSIHIKLRNGLPFTRPLGELLLERASIKWAICPVRGGVIPA